jgi:hypothetical protein
MFEKPLYLLSHIHAILQLIEKEKRFLGAIVDIQSVSRYYLPEQAILQRFHDSVLAVLLVEDGRRLWTTLT